MIHGWRAQIHSWSRNSGFLKRLSVSIAVGSFLLALLIIAVTPDTSRFVSVDPLEQKLRTEWQRLDRVKEPLPHELVRWLHHVTDNIHHLCRVLGIKTTTWEDYAVEGTLAGHEVRPLLTQHSTDPAVIQLWEDFIKTSLSRDAASALRLSGRASEEPPLITANFIQAYRLADTAPSQSLAVLMKEATLFPTPLVREAALHTALQQQDVPVMKAIAAQPEWWSTMPAGLRRSVAAELGDFRLQVEGMLEYRFLLDAPLAPLFVALVAASIWYVILVLHGVTGRWRWVFPLLPLAAGILSVWPVFLIDSWQEFHLGTKEDGPFPQDLWYQIGGVGMREELCKLFLASLFMPWLLIKRSAGGALMIGAFVGLGFALEENIAYYMQGPAGVALSRFFTANFFHAALTGISTHAFYQLWRSRFGTADRFIVTFLGVAVAHGAYNYGYSTTFDEGRAYLSMIVLAFVAWHFLDLVQQECQPGRQWISPGAVFLVGTALLMAVVFLSVAILTPDRQLLAAAATQCVAMFPVVFIYWHRLRV